MMINMNSIEVLSRITNDLLDQELSGVSEFEVKSEVKKKSRTEGREVEIKDFNLDYFYYVATHQLNMSEERFLSSTLRQILIFR